MPINKDLSVTPWYDDFDPQKHFNRVLFKPSVSIQARELNQLQSILDHQIELFGANIFKQGTIIAGCNFSFNNRFAYVKLADADTLGLPLNLPNFVNLYATSIQTDVKAVIKDYANGFVSSNPDLNTIYIDYMQSGSSLEDTFSPGETLRINDANNQIWSVLINSSGSSYSNSDNLIFISQIAVSVTSGSFQVGETVSQAISNTRATILAVNNTIFDDMTVLSLAPDSVDLSNTELITFKPWDFIQDESILGETSLAAGSVSDIFGKFAEGKIVTDGSGRVVQTVITNPGVDYRLVPYVTVKPSLTPAATTTGLSLSARNFYADVKIPNLSNVVGYGYSMAVSSGVIWQKGYFIDVDSQSIIVQKYHPFPNNISVVFQTTENIITSSVDPTLLDNALGAPNYTAPGADRLQLIAELALVNTDIVEDSSELLTLVSFSEGNPYKQNQTTQYNLIEAEMAKRTYDESGNFVIDPFQSITKSPANTKLESNTFTAVVDPGTAYISGHRLQTLTNFTENVRKGTNIGVQNNVIISLDYDYYIQIKEVGGVFQYQIGDTVIFYNTVKKFITNTATALIANTTPIGTAIGRGRIRSMTLESGTPGTNSAIYNLYLFNLHINTGFSFSQAKSVYYSNGAGYYSGIADIVLTTSPTTNTQIAQITGNNNLLLFPAQVDFLQKVANAVYTYRTINNAVVIANNGTGSISISGNPNETFPYTGSLSSAQMRDLYIVPLANNLISFANLAGAVSVTTTSSNLTGTSTTFTTQLAPGDYVKLTGNSTQSDVKRVVAIVNDTIAIVDSNSAIVNTAALVFRYFPPDIPVPFGVRSGLTANVNPAKTQLTLDFGMTFSGTTSSNIAAGFNVTRTNVSPGTKTAVRTNIVGLRLANNAGGTNGPWCLGVPDIIRLRKVFYANSTYGIIPGEITDSFYIDHGQTTNLLGPGWLYKTPQSAISLSNTQYLVVKFDCVTTATPGFMAAESYVGTNSAVVQNTDSMSVAAISNSIMTYEVPELYNNKNRYFDLLSYVDFRPTALATANITQSISNITVNPPFDIDFDTSADFKFPLPGSELTANISFYMGRIDNVVLDSKGFIEVVHGPARRNNLRPPPLPKNSLLIDSLLIPPYPGIPARPSVKLINQIGTRMASERYSFKRIQDRRIKSIMPLAESQITQIPGYTMADIGEMDRRLRAVEYYVSLNQLETLVVNEAIPSSIANSISRFKYGFFVDDFSSNNFLDLDNPEYNATLYTGRARLYPLSDIINTTHGGSYVPQATEFMLSRQTLASYTPPRPPPVGNTLPPNDQTIGEDPPPLPCIPSNISGNTSLTTFEGFFTHTGANYLDVFKLRLSDHTGNGTLFYTSLFANTRAYGNLFTGNTYLVVQIFQSQSPATLGTMIANNQSSVVPTINDFPTIESRKAFTISTAVGGNTFVPNALMLKWHHNPNNGLYYTIKEYQVVGDILSRLFVYFTINANNKANCVNTNTGPRIESTARTLVSASNTFVVDGETFQFIPNTSAANLIVAYETDGVFVSQGGGEYTIDPFVIPDTPPTISGFANTQDNTLPTIATDTYVLSGYINQRLLIEGISNGISESYVLFFNDTALIQYKRPLFMLEYYNFAKMISTGQSLTDVIEFLGETTEGVYVETNDSSLFINSTPYDTSPANNLVLSSLPMPHSASLPEINTNNISNVYARGISVGGNTSQRLYPAKRVSTGL